MPGKLRTMKIGGKRRVVYRRKDGKYKVGKCRYAVYSGSRDAKRHARHKVSNPRYRHAGDYNTRHKTHSGRIFGFL